MFEISVLGSYIAAGIHGLLFLIGASAYCWKIPNPIIQNRGFILAILQSLYSVIHFSLLAVRQGPDTSCLLTYFSTTFLLPFYIFVRKK
jgi:hypothetical protein